MNWTKAPLTALIATLMLAVVPTASAAGTYEVVACDAAGGPNRSWAPQPGVATPFTSWQRCPAVGGEDGFGVKSAGAMLRATQLSGAWWRFDAPSGTSIRSIDWAGRYSTASAGWASRIESSRGTVVGCGPSATACARRFTTGSRPEHRSIGGASWLRIGSVCLAPAGCRTGDGRGTSFAEAALGYALVTVSDPEPPKVAVTGSGWNAAWSQPGGLVDVSASDASGIQSIEMAVDGERVASKAMFCDFTLPRPCADRTTGFRLPAGLSDGRHSIEVSATDAAGNGSTQRLEVGVDDHAPKAGDAPVVAGGDSWRRSDLFELQWQLPPGDGGSPIVASWVTVCPVALKGVACLTPIRIPAGVEADQSSKVELPAEGAWEARVSFEDGAGNRDQTLASPPASLRWDTAEPGPGQIVVPSGWITAERARSLSAGVRLADGVEPPASGIAGWVISASETSGDRLNVPGASVLWPVAGLPEGTTRIFARAVSGSGVASQSVVSASVNIDATPPSVEPAAEPPSGWIPGPFTVTAIGRDQPGLSGMGGGGDSSAGVVIRVDGQIASSEADSSASATITADGDHSVELEATDAAGNRSGRRQLRVRIDSSAPERVAFLPQDEADPRVVRVEAGDALSGLDTLRIAIRPIAGGQWTDLPVEQVAGRFQATLDESSMAHGLWELQATAVDLAGNRTVSGRTLSGDPALMTLPLRRVSRIEAVMSSSGGGSAATVGGSVAVIRNGVPAIVSGRLLDSEGEPVQGGLLSAAAEALVAGSKWSDLGVVTSDRTGSFRLVVPGGPSRRIKLSFEGDRRHLPASAAMEVHVPSATTIAVSPSRVRVGSTAVFSGRLAGGWIPSGGKIVVVQAMIPGRGWQTFSVTRAGQDGSWSARYRFRSTIGRVSYSIRAVVPAEAAYPFGLSMTRPIKVIAVG